MVYTLAAQDVITDECYSVRADGSYWLEGLGRRMLIQSVNDYLDEQQDFQAEPMSRASEIASYCKKLAQKFKHYE